MSLEVVCRNCKRPYVPSKGDVISGVYRLCPKCRPVLVKLPEPTIEDDSPTAA